VLEVTQPRLPCYKLGIRLGAPKFLRRFAEELRTGAYLRVVKEGDIGAGDAIFVTRGPALDLSLRSMAIEILGF
jgi:MOSC domain-containing protein YiiM